MKISFVFVCVYLSYGMWVPRYNCQYALLKFVEENQKVPAAFRMDLSKGLDALPHDILVAKLYTYGMLQETVTLLASYLRNRKQIVKVGNYESDWEPLSKGVLQGSIMGTILFNLFVNDLYCLSKTLPLQIMLTITP